MTASSTTTPARPFTRRVNGVLAIAGVVTVAVWAATAGQEGVTEPTHDSPAVVEPIGHGEKAWVTLTPEAARRIGLEAARVRVGSSGVEVPYSSVIYAADGSTWVYAADPADQLRFRREEVHVKAVRGDRVILRDGPPAGTIVAGAGTAELYGSEFEVGH
ncbi:hypothetical protein [Nocardioides pyridinolyticus]